MAIYHFSAKIIGRSSGRSAVAAAAYRAGEKIKNERDGITHDYSHRHSVAFSEIMLPANAPREFENRKILWNAVEKSEVRKDAQTAREIEIALPIEFNLDEQKELLREYVRENFVSEGMCADVAIHDNVGNPHAHIMLTTRNIEKEVFGKKNREWNNVEKLETWRENWATVCNREFEKKELKIRIDNRSLEAQKINREPTIHVGRSSERKVENQEIIKRNNAYKIPEKENIRKPIFQRLR